MVMVIGIPLAGVSPSLLFLTSVSNLHRPRRHARARARALWMGIEHWSVPDTAVEYARTVDLGHHLASIRICCVYASPARRRFGTHLYLANRYIPARASVSERAHR